MSPGIESFTFSPLFGTGICFLVLALINPGNYLYRMCPMVSVVKVMISFISQLVAMTVMTVIYREKIVKVTIIIMVVKRSPWMPV